LSKHYFFQKLNLRVFFTCYFEMLLLPKWIIVQKRAIRNTSTKLIVDLKSTKSHCQYILNIAEKCCRFSYLIRAGFFLKVKHICFLSFLFCEMELKA